MKLKPALEAGVEERAMSYEDIPPRQFKAKITDINKLSTLRIIKHLYKKHELVLWQAATVITYVWLIVRKFN